MAEAGLAGYEATPWYGVLAPANTPRAALARLNAEVVKALNDPEIRARLEDQGMDPAGNTIEQFSAHIQAELVKWSHVIKEAGIKLTP